MGGARRSPFHRNLSVLTVTVRSIRRHDDGKGRNPGLTPTTSSTTCWPSTSFQSKVVRVAPNVPSCARADASADPTAAVGSGESATASAAVVAEAVNAEVA